jgi:DNA primase
MSKFIDEDVVRQVKQTANVYNTISQFLTLKKVGQGYTAKCPFHNEKSESFTVSQSKNIYKCFGCGKSGNSINFLMEHKGMSYPEALAWLAEKNNITLIYKAQ